MPDAVHAQSLVGDLLAADYDALPHREVLLMIDVPGRRVAEIEALAYKRHSEAIAGGTSWAVDAIGM